jgi:RHS repeat-associated protein
VVTGVQSDASFDFRLPGPLPIAWNRFYSSARHLEPLPLGFGHTHQYDHLLTLDLDGASYRGPTGEVVPFPDVSVGGSFARAGVVLSRRTELEYDITLPRGDRLEFTGSVSRSVGLTRLWRASRSISFSYDSGGLLTKIVDALGRSLLVSHDAGGRILGITLTSVGAEGPGVKKTLVSYEYDVHGNLASARDSHGFVQSFAYDGRHLLIRRTDRKGYSFLFAYDEAGRCVHSKGEDGLYDVQLQFDPQAKATYVRKASSPPFTYRYNDAGALTHIVDPYGAVTTFLLDDAGRAVSEIDPNGNVTTLHYDRTGQLDYRIDPNGHRLPSTTAEPEPADPLAVPLPQTSLAWEFGRFLDTQGLKPLEPNDSVLARLPAAVADAVSGPRWSSNGDVPHSEADQAESVQLNDAGQPAEQSTAFSAERWRYDPNGNEIEHQDRDGSVWRATFASWNCLRERIDPLGNITRFENNPSGLFTKIIDAGGTSVEYEYDYNDRVVQVRRQGEVVESYVRDPAGNIVTKIDAKGLATVSWDIAPGNVDKSRTLLSGERHEFEYDAKGRVVAARWPSGAVALGYGTGGEVVSDTRDGAGVRHELENGELAGTVYFDRFAVNYYRNEDGDRLIVDPTGRTHRFKRSDSGLITKKLGNGTTEFSQFDGCGRCLCKALFRESVSAPPLVTSYAYSRTGNLVRIADTERGSTRYAYDAAHRLAEEVTSGEAPRRFVFDRAGNLIAQPGLSGVRIDAANRLVEANGNRFEYDIHDRVIASAGAGGTRRYGYDDLGMLVRCEIDGEEWTAAYDPLGRRTTKVWQGHTSTYFWDEFRLAAEVRDDSSLRLYLYPDLHSLVPFLFIEYAGLDADPSSGESYAVFTNQVAVPVRVEDSRGNACWQARSDPFGRIEIERSSTIDMPLRFPGHYCDKETGLHYNRFRYFNPGLGRYLQADPAGQIGGINLFAYPVSPLVAADLDGLGASKVATAPKAQKAPKAPKACPYDLSTPGNQALLEKPLDQMTPEELKKYAVLRAKRLQEQHVGGNDRADQGVTTAVTILTDKDGKILKDKDGNPVVLITQSSERRTTPTGMVLKPGEKFVSPDPQLSDRKVKDADGNQVMVPAGPKNKDGTVPVDDKGRPLGGWKEETQTVDKKTGQPYDRDKRSEHHAEQRGVTAVDDHNKGKSEDEKAKIGAIGPSRPCCEGCNKSLKDSNNLDKVDKDSQE